MHSPAQPSVMHDSPSALLPGTAREALALSVRLLDIAEQHRRPADMCQALAQVGRCYRLLNAWGPAEHYMAQALRWANVLGANDPVLDLLCDLAETACSAADMPADGQPFNPRAAHAARDRARDHAFEVARLAKKAADPQWEIKVLLRASDVLDRCGDHDDAIQLQTRVMSLIARAEAPAPAGDDNARPHAAVTTSLLM